MVRARDERPASTLMTPTFDEMRRILRELPGPDLAARTEVVRRQAELTKPPGSLGRLEEIAEWLAAWQGRASPRVERPRIAVFAGTHGVAARGVSAYPPEVTGQMVKNFLDGGAAINQLAAAIDADLRIYELDLAHPTDDFTQGPAMSETRTANAMAYGMMAAEPGIDVLCLGEMGIANTTTAATLSAALFGGSGADWAGPGTGVKGAALTHKIAVIDGLHRCGRRALCRRPARARPLPGRPSLGRTRPYASAAGDRPAAAPGHGHAAGRGLGGRVGRASAQGRRRLPQWHGDLRAGRRERQRGVVLPSRTRRSWP